ncbi:MAG: hypothetical protein R3D57_17485 [Hyphomicrobiaceae bacterium]
MTDLVTDDSPPLDFSGKAKLRRWWSRNKPRRSVAGLTALLALVAGYLHFVLLPSYDVATEIKERRSIRAEVGHLLDRSDYAALEAMAESFRSEKSRTESGIWKLTVYYSGISAKARLRGKSDPAWGDLSAKLKAWQEQYPDSPTPVIANAIAMRKYAQALKPIVVFQRASTAAPSEDEVFVSALRADQAYLERYAAVASKDPHFYVVWSNLAFALGADPALFFDVVEEGMRSHPDYYQLYFAAMDFHAPSLRGDATAVEAFANMAAERTRSSEGLGLYTRVYWYAKAAYFGDDLFRRSEVNWPKMSAGIDDILARYPDQWNINNFARLACLAGDSGKTRALLDRIEGTPIPQVWKSSSALRGCRRLAKVE